MPSVLPASTRSASICSNAALAFLYIRGNAMTVAASMHPIHVWTTCMLNVSSRNIPKGLLRLKIRSRKKPATVGGSTIGRVSMPSSTDFIL